MTFGLQYVQIQIQIQIQKPLLPLIHTMHIES